MIQRSLHLSNRISFFLFGARGTGKTQLLKQEMKQAIAFFDLLKPELFRELQKHPESFITRLPKNRKAGDWIVIDEIQRVPELLNIVHAMIEEERLKFAMTGSSARKLKRAGSNLLGGRAIIFHLYPFTSKELSQSNNAFNLEHILQWGSLPILYNVSNLQEKKMVLDAYIDTYIREEIREEQLIRKLDPFLRFLEIAAQMNGKIINASSIAKDSQADPRMILRYFEILEDTLLGFHLDAYHRSIRKSQRQSPKFYFFDNGVSRALAGLNGVEVRKGSKEYGDLFESFFINEVIRLNHYHQKGYKLSYLRTKDGLEVDLIIDKPRQKPIMIEIKSSSLVHETDFDRYKALKKDLGANEFWVACQEIRPKHSTVVEILPWQEVLNRLF